MTIATIEIQPRVETVEFHSDNLTARLKDDTVGLSYEKPYVPL